MLAKKDEILELIPQKPPMIMVDKLIEFNNDIFLSGFYIHEDNILVRDGHLSEAGLIENIAQSAALMTGWEAKQKGFGDGTPQVGVIGGIKNLEIKFLPEVNSELNTEIIVLHEVLNASIISGTIKVNNDICLTCEMKIFLTRDE